MPSLQDALLNAINKPVQQPAPTPDLKAMVDEWAQDDQPTTKEKTMANLNPVVIIDSNKGRPMFGISNNVSRETFNYVRDNPGKTRKQVVQDMVAKGFKETSVSSLINQLTVANQITRGIGDVLVANVKEYIPIKAKDLKKIRASKQATKAKELLAKAKAARAEKRAAKQAPKAAVKPVVEEPKQKYQPKEAAGIAALSPTTMPLIDLTAEKILDTLGVRQAKVLYAELKKIFEE
jgi:hypothetical protein